MTQKAEQAEIEAKLRNERTNLRRLFTVSANTFDDIHHKIDKVKDIHVQYNKVVEKAERLFKVDDEIKECIIFTDEEYDTTESYRDRFTEIRVVYEKQYTQDESSSVVSKILKAWDRYRLNREDKEDDPVVSKDKVLENLMIFLRHEVEGEEHRFLAETSFGDGMKRKESRKPPLRDEPTAATLIANTSVGRNQCIFCERAHASQDCQKISNLAYEDRKGQVMRKRCCLVCLKPGHMAKRCHSSVKCLICGRRHYALLCPDLRKDKISSKSREVDEEQHSTETLLTNLPLERKIYLKTITVRLRHKNKEVCVRALMDDGSHRSYIVKSLVAELDLSPSGTEVLSQGLFGGGISPSMEYGRFTVTVESLDRKYSTSMSFLGQPKICSTLPRIISVENKEELLRFKEQTMQIMNAASFELRSWAHTGIKHLESQNVLGLKWDTETDELYCVHPEADMGISDTVSKRKLLSIVNSIYDPIGFTSPATLLPKLLLQEAWRNKLNWDEELPPDMQKRYQRWAKHFDLIESCRIPRKLFYGSFEKATLHIFKDASAHGYPRIVRMTAWILRFCRNIRVNSDKLTKELSYEEIQRAEEALIRLIQSEWPSDIREKYTQTIQFYEENKILKVRSRLILGEDPEDFVRPTVLPDHPIVRRLIDYIHQKLHHAGVQTTLSHLRERFWIPRGRRVAIKPSDFIQDIKGTEVLDLDIVDAKLLRKRIRYLQNLRYQLRQRFQKEYLSELIRNPQLAPKRCNLSVGDIVLVGSDNVKRLNWPLGRVIEMFQGQHRTSRQIALKSAPDTFSSAKQCSTSNDQSFQSEDLPKEQEETLKKTRLGRQIVPPKRLDL
ncbi:transposable element Tc1 transposase [Nephila pilipes]|uniref:Transposable element Tc1 transposase n=1 Tax=Nephila pilipes TaxID=299642 RepID=A0A8X6T9T3_NEPPI|nr:transposable element Tc1 transposase [Nephila pilipes]GFU46522.1 transposable element Tc1 transposase [Nephila pilipes]